MGGVSPLLPKAKTGRPRVHEPRELLDAIWYVLRTGQAWRMLPHDFPAWETVYSYFRLLKRTGTWQRLNDELRTQVRVRAGREAEPSTVVIDSQSVKTAEKRGLRGYDGGKHVKGRKRHLAVDSVGLLVRVVVHAANVSDKTGVWWVIRRIPFFSRWKRVLLDAGYDTDANREKAKGWLGIDYLLRVCYGLWTTR